MEKHQRKKMGVGQALVEYIIVLALVIIVIIVALSQLGINLRAVYCSVVGGLGGKYCQHYCQDDFSSSDGWSQMNNKGWSISNGKMCNTGSYEQRAFNTCSQNDLPKDYMITLKNANLSQGDGYGLFFRLQSTNPTNGVVFQYDPGAKGFLFRKWVNGWEVNPAIAFKSMPGYNWHNVPHNISVKVQGNTYTGYVDGQPILTATDNTFSGGSTGLRTWDRTKMCAEGYTIDPIP